MVVFCRVFRVCCQCSNGHFPKHYPSVFLSPPIRKQVVRGYTSRLCASINPVIDNQGTISLSVRSITCLIHFYRPIDTSIQVLRLPSLSPSCTRCPRPTPLYGGVLVSLQSRTKKQMPITKKLKKFPLRRMSNPTAGMPWLRALPLLVPSPSSPISSLRYSPSHFLARTSPGNGLGLSHRV